MSKLSKKYIDKWYTDVVPYINNKDFNNSLYEALKLFSQVADDIGERKLSYEIWKLYNKYC